MSLTELLQELDGLQYLNDDGEPRRLHRLPPLSPAELARLPRGLPQELLDCLRFSRGLAGAEHAAESVDLSGLSNSGQYLEELCPEGLAIATDDCGNSWTYDPPTERVFFICHDPPVVVYQFANLEEFLNELRRQPCQSELGDPLQRAVERIWGKNPGVLGADQGDGVVTAFARQLGEGWEFVDLRQPRPGDGFSWGRYGPDTEVKRHSSQCIVALRRPAKKPSLWKRLFG